MSTAEKVMDISVQSEKNRGEQTSNIISIKYNSRDSPSDIKLNHQETDRETGGELSHQELKRKFEKLGNEKESQSNKKLKVDQAAIRILSEDDLSNSEDVIVYLF